MGVTRVAAETLVTEEAGTSVVDGVGMGTGRSGCMRFPGDDVLVL